MTKFDVISPDGLPINPNNYSSEEKARTAFKKWAKRFEMQGYYSSIEGRIALDDLQSNCTLVLTERGRRIDSRPL
jgi:hypothetical protein